MTRHWIMTDKFDLYPRYVTLPQYNAAIAAGLSVRLHGFVEHMCVPPRHLSIAPKGLPR